MLHTRVLDVLFPRRCAGCGSGAWPFCSDCSLEIDPVLPPMCERCGAPRTRAVSQCADCPPPEIRRARSPFVFDGAIRRAVHRLKFAGDRSVAEAFAEAMVASGDFKVDVISWVPLSRRRLSERGYDQAKALAVAVERRLAIPARPLLRRVADPGPQARRGGVERRRAMNGVFASVGGEPSAASVLLIDDVLTTGATAAAAAGRLREAGAVAVDLLVAARALGSRREYSR